VQILDPVENSTLCIQLLNRMKLQIEMALLNNVFRKCYKRKDWQLNASEYFFDKNLTE